MDQKLVETARAVLDNLPLNQLSDLGVLRERERYYLNISYPSLQAMDAYDSSGIDAAALMNTVALYVHIPFCSGICKYCHYLKVAGARRQQIDDYLKALSTELHLYMQLVGRRLRAASIYVGGGTPGILDPEQIEMLFSSIYAAVDAVDGCEISFEMHPETVTVERLTKLKSLGVNRISMGVETFDDQILSEENRRHTSEDALRAYRLLEDHGPGSINIDLIYGLEGQTAETWEHDLDYISKLKPPSFCAYHLRIREGTRTFVQFNSNPQAFASENDVLLMHVMTFERMREIDYFQPIVDWFVRSPGSMHRYQDHNWRSTDTTPLVGTGASAYSYIAGSQYYNHSDIGAYTRALEQGELPIWRGIWLDQEESLRRSIVLGGLKIGIPRQQFSEIYGEDPYHVFRGLFDRLATAGAVTIDDASINLTYLGALFADEIAGLFRSTRMLELTEAVPNRLISTTSEKLLNRRLW